VSFYYFNAMLANDDALMTLCEIHKILPTFLRYSITKLPVTSAFLHLFVEIKDQPEHQVTCVRCINLWFCWTGHAHWRRSLIGSAHWKSSSAHLNLTDASLGTETAGWRNLLTVDHVDLERRVWWLTPASGRPPSSLWSP